MKLTQTIEYQALDIQLRQILSMGLNDGNIKEAQRLSNKIMELWKNNK